MIGSVPVPGRRRGAVLGAVAVGALCVASLLTTGADALPEPDEDPSMTAGTTFLVSGSGSPSPYDPTAGHPAVSGDGSRVAFDAGEPGEGGGRTIEVRATDTREGPTVDIGGDSTVPSLSDDGRLVAFQNAWDGSAGSEGDGADVYVTDLSGDRPATRRVTDVASDLHYQRVPECDPDPLPREPDSASASRCGPVLSGDGSTLAFQARLSVVSPDIAEIMDDEGPAEYLDGNRGLALVDLGSDLVYRVLTVRAGGTRPVRFDRVRVTAGQGTFSVFTPPGANRCRGATLQPGTDECEVAVSVSRPEDQCRTSFGALTFDGPTPRSRTVVRLGADQVGGCEGGGGGGDGGGGGGGGGARVGGGGLTARRQAACPPHPTPESLPFSASDRYEPFQSVSFGQRATDAPVLLAQRITNYDPQGEGAGPDAEIQVQGAGCAFRLLQPDVEEDPSSPPGQQPCEPGQPLDYYDSCTAYVSFRPGTVSSYAATVNLVDQDSGAPIRRFRLLGAGTRDVVVVRRDPERIGRFRGPGRPDPAVASIDQAGTVVDGVSPSLSFTGRQVAFASTRDGRYAGTQVLVHDTDRTGDGTFLRGPTVLASRLRPGPGGLPDAALQPSLSGDGSRVAFTTFHDLGPDQVTYVRVRDLALARTVVASAARDGTFAGAASFAPSLSRDGGTVAYVSFATNLLDDDKACCSADIYVRELAADFGEVETASGSPNEIVSMAVDGGPVDDHLSGAPAANGDGSVVAFVSSAELVPEAIAFSPQVYARARFAEPDVSPGSIEFPTQQVDTVGPPRTVTVTNLGPGPVTVTTAVTGPFQVTDGCDGLSLHRGETCLVTVSFAPTSGGDQEGTVTVTSDSFAWTGAVEIVGLAGESVPLLFTVEPGALDFPTTGIGLESEPITVTATNLGSLPMTLAAAVTTGEKDFAVEPDPETCTELAPGASCELETTFVPSGLGDLAGLLQVVGTVEGLPYTQDLPATGAAAAPSVEFSPEVTREGRVVFVSGEHFLPGKPVKLTWDTGQVAAPVIIPDDEGAFSAPVVILTGRGPGIRQLVVSMPSVKESDVEAPPLLVALGSAQPPDFVNRN